MKNSITGTNTSNMGKNGSQKKKGKNGSTERDSINALLSLGRDLPGEEAEDVEMGATGPENIRTPTDKEIMSTKILKRPPQPILPDALAAKPCKKRQKNIGNGAAGTTKTDNGNSPSEPKTLPDFWYWLLDGEAVGEWDVLCGRGGESNNFIGNRRFRKLVHSKKEEYRQIPIKQRKLKTAFVRSIVERVNETGGRFLDLDETSGKYYAVTMEKARKKTSQALRETKELKWLEISDESGEVAAKDSVCPYCQKPGHKTRIAKACLKHHEWAATNSASPGNKDSAQMKQQQLQNDAHAPNEMPAVEV